MLGLGLGVTLVLVWLSSTSSRPVVAATARTGRTRDLLDRAGLAGTTVGGRLGGVRRYGTGGARRGPGGLAHYDRVPGFGLLSGYLPVAMLSGRAHRRTETSPRHGPKPSTTSPEPYAPGCRSRTRSSGSGTADRSRCASRSSRSAWTTQVTGRFAESLDRLKATEELTWPWTTTSGGAVGVHVHDVHRLWPAASSSAGGCTCTP